MQPQSGAPEFQRRTMHLENFRLGQIKRDKRRLQKLFARLRQCTVCRVAYSGPSPTCKSETCKREHARRKAVIASGYDPFSKPCKVCGLEVETTGKVRSFRPQMCRTCAAKAARLSKRRAKRRRESKQAFATSKHAPVAVLTGLRTMIDRAGNRCPCCGLLMSKAAHVSSDRALELDHAMPLSKGGDDLFHNLRPMCRRCNGMKRDFVAPLIVIGEWLSQCERKDLWTVHGGSGNCLGVDAGVRSRPSTQNCEGLVEALNQP